ncbi:hypothetical protein LEM8419_00514 [Neolewinella maritima]|uniref:Haloacid dehalogenase-like hydrolase n=2 Tax=Neolewinella maritima TaxID=1383882 RepID=A0ABM9AXP7_9BACT|nr:hypothetical protein LEM8419_00514 [Neolewinella maritima]
MTDAHLQLAVVHLNDVCVAVQEGMDRFLATAALDRMAGAEATFSWLRKRGVRICLLSDYDESQTLLLLKRLGWTVGEAGTVQQFVPRQQELDNPVLQAHALAGLTKGRLSITAVDTPELLRHSNAARVHFNLAICNGRSPYHALATAPHHAMLDNLRQLPDFLVRHLPEPARPTQRLYLPRPLYTA